MIALLQRVAEASVHVNEILAENLRENLREDLGENAARITGGNIVGQIGRGTLALVGVERGDGEGEAERLVQRILAWRMFDDGMGRMNLNLAQIEGGLLLVPQFTLAADTNSGNRPSFTPAAPPAEGQRLFDLVLSAARRQFAPVESGVFGADMKVSLVNDGPVTFWLRVGAHS